MTKREFAVAFNCAFHCNERSCADCREIAGLDPDMPADCPATDEYRDIITQISDKFLELYGRNANEDNIDFDELVAIFDSQLN